MGRRIKSFAAGSFEISPEQRSLSSVQLWNSVVQKSHISFWRAAQAILPPTRQHDHNFPLMIFGLQLEVLSRTKGNG
ncbi:hypothetical protein ABFA07_023372 [Porites harrisoni]